MKNLKELLMISLKLPNAVIILAIFLIYGMSISFFLPYQSMFFIYEVGISNSQLGIFMTISTISGVMIATYIGRLSDVRLSRRKTLMLTTLASLIGSILYSFVRDYFALLAIQCMIFGVASAGWPQILAYARDVAEEARIGKENIPFVMNLFRTFFTIAWTIGPVIAGFLLLHVQFSGLFLFISLGYLLVYILVLFYVKERENAKRKGQAKADNPTKLMLNPFIMANFTAMMLVSAASTISLMNMSLFIIEILQGTERHVGVVFGIPPIFEIPFMIGVGYLATKIKSIMIMRIGLLIAGLYFVLLFTVQDVWQIYPLQILNAAYISVSMGIAISYFQNFIPNEQGTATTLYTNATRLGQAIGLLTFGFLADIFGYRFLFLVCGALSFASLSLLFVREYGLTKKKSRHVDV